jgi:hypothetical protein
VVEGGRLDGHEDGGGIESCSGEFLSLTDGMWRSRRLRVFDTYHGASTI